MVPISVGTKEKPVLTAYLIPNFFLHELREFGHLQLIVGRSRGVCAVAHVVVEAPPRVGVVDPAIDGAAVLHADEDNKGRGGGKRLVLSEVAG